MSILPITRREISAVCRQSNRLIHSSSTHRAAILSPAEIREEEIEEISIQPIFDIFDAPTRLAETREFIQSKYKASTKSTSVPTPRTSKPSLARPTPLPAPIIFDGPARPRNEALAFQRRLRDAGLTPSPLPRRNQTPAARPFSSSEPLVQLFEGPARISRYHHHSSSNEQERGSLKFIAVLGVAGAVGFATLAQDDQKSE